MIDDADIIERFATLPTANVCDAMDRLGALHGIRPVWDGARVASRAYTVWTRAGDNLYIHKAMEEVPEKYVIVVNGEGDTSRALIGDLIGARAFAKGVAGFVIDGAVRDGGGLAEVGIPVFARNVTPAGPYKNGPGKLDVVVAVGGVAIAPGDLILGDEDGVVVVPWADREAVLVRSEEIFANEISKRADIEANLGAKPLV
jgi:regulator of RNase E activity RraA